MTMMETSPTRPPSPLPTTAALSPLDAMLMEKAKALETAFLAEMLAYSGRDADADSAFGGGAGEEQFASFLRQEEARMMVDRGGIGLAESLFRALSGASGNG